MRIRLGIPMLFLLLFGNLPPALAASTILKPIYENKDPDNPFAASQSNKVAIVQWANPAKAPVHTGASAQAHKKENWHMLEKYIREAAENGAKLVVTPELSTVGTPAGPDGFPPEDIQFKNAQEALLYAEPIPGPTSQYFGSLAKELRIYLHVGLLELQNNKKMFNTVIAIDPSGNVIATYRKINLLEAEERYLEAGSQRVVYHSPWGKVGMVIYSDIYSRNPMSDYKEDEIQVLALSTNWARMNTAWNYFSKGAKWSNAFLLVANQTSFPDSGVINPDGSAQSHIRQSSGVAYGWLPLKGTSIY